MATAPEDTADWTVQIADRIESVVGSIQAKTTTPLQTIARAAVYGILTLVMGTMALVLLTIGAVRLLDAWLEVWQVYAIVGGLFTVAGLLCWRARRPAAH